MKKSEFAFFLFFVLLGIQAFAFDSFSKNETPKYNFEASESVVFSSVNHEFIAELGNVETILPSANSISFLSKNRILDQNFDLITSVFEEIQLLYINSGVIVFFTLEISNILDFLHPYFFFY